MPAARKKTKSSKGIPPALKFKGVRATADQQKANRRQTNHGKAKLFSKGGKT